MTSPSCANSIPRGPFTSPTNGSATTHCVLPAFENITSIITTCFDEQQPGSNETIVTYTTNTSELCEYVYVNVSDSYSVRNLSSCWGYQKTGVSSGCYGVTAKDRNMTEAADKEGSAGRVEGRVGVLISVILVVGVLVDGGLGM